MKKFSLTPALILIGACSSLGNDDQADFNNHEDHDHDTDHCVETQTDCTPRYEPTFQNVHARTLVPSCALAGGACHGDPDAEGGFSLADDDTAYVELSRHVEPGNAECGNLMWRLHVDQPSAQMPPGTPLPAGELCAMVQWVEQGAKR